MSVKLTEKPIHEEASKETLSFVAVDNGALARIPYGTLFGDNDKKLQEAYNYLSQLNQLINDGIVVGVTLTETGLKVDYSDGTSETLTITGSGGLAFNGGYQDVDGYVHLTQDGEDIEGFDPIKISGGSGDGGTGSKLTVSSYTPTAFSANSSSGTAPIKLKFKSIDAETGLETGAGNMAIYVGGILKTNMTIEQGDITIDPFLYLNTGANTVKLMVTDSYGSTATRNFSITLESFGLEWSLTPTVKNTESVLSFYITPTGSGSKTIYTYIDGTLQATDVVATSGRRITKTITGLTHGAHTIEVYGVMDVGGTSLESDHLTAAIAQVYATSTTPVIAVNWPAGSLTQYTTAQIDYIAIDPLNNPATVQRVVNEVVQSTEIHDQSAQTWSYRPVTHGTTTLGILCGDQMQVKEYTVDPIGADVDEVTDGLEIKIDPATMTNLEDWSYGNYSFTLSDHFDQVNGGLTTDENGVHCIRVTAGDRLTLNYSLFSGDARKNGKEAKIIYTVKNSSSKETTAISCVADGIGLQVNANNVYLSGNQTTVTLSTCEDEKTELDLNIQRDSEDRLIYMWERCSTFSYKQYASNESFTQATPRSITFGSDDADVYLYLFRAYNRDLTESELKANFIADGADGAEILNRKMRNEIYDSAGNIDLTAASTQNPNAHFLVINADRMTLGKKDAVNCTVQHAYVAGGTEHQWTALSTMKVQGTSSVEHADTAGPNINFEFPNGFTLEDGTIVEGYAMNGTDKSIPVNKLTFKKNVASQDHIINRACAEWYNNYQPSIRPARLADSRVRDCLESVMCVVLFHNTGSEPVRVGPDTIQPNETAFFGLGNLCSNKDSTEAFEYHDIVIEVLNNTEPQVLFQSDDLTGNNFSNNYEFRHLNTSKYTEAEAQAEWQEVQTFAYETNYLLATNVALPKAVIINGQTFTVDSAAYRKAKWKAQAPNYFDMATLYWHHNDTLFFLLRDNRAKNMFWSLNEDEKWGLWFNWDNDTGLCRNNEGYVDIEPGYMDFDTIGTADVFNGASNAVFANLRECNADELRASYLDRESAGAWNIDAFYKYCMDSQEQICEALWIEDAQHNAIRTMQNLGTTAYLERSTGRLRLHIKKALTFQKVMVDSYYNATAATADSASFRGYTPSGVSVAPSGIVKITMYTDMYINVLAGSIAYKVRAKAGEEVEIDISTSLNDTEIYFRHAPWIQKFGDLSRLYLGQFEASKLIRVRTLLIGSNTAEYQNTNFTVGSFENCVKLEELNLGGLVNAAQSLDLSKNIYARKVYTKGSGITGITFAKNGRLREAYLNAVSSLYMSGLQMLETFEMESYDKLTSLSVEDSPAVDSYAITSAAASLNRVRLLGIAWSVDVAAYNTLLRLHRIHGIDDDGYETETGVLTGTVYFSAIGKSKYETISTEITTITFTYGEQLEEFSVTFQNDDGTILNVQQVERGGSAVDPIEMGYTATPTKARDTDYDYTYWKWDTSLNYILEDTTITAMYRQTTRTYSVDYTVNGTIKEHYDVPAHGSASYQGADPEQEGYLFGGWSAEAVDVISDMVISAVMIYPTLPSTVADLTQFDYAYSDDNADNAAYSKAEFAGIILSGRGKTYFAVKDIAKMVPNSSAITDTSIIVQVEDFNHFKLADGSGNFADIAWGMIGVLNASKRMNSTNTNVGGWPATEIRQWANETLYPTLPPFWRSLMKKVIVRSSAGDTTPDIVQSQDYLFLRSHAEIGWDTAAVPYCNEVDPDAENTAFACYTDNASRVKKFYNGTGAATNWWLRSPDPSGSLNFRDVYSAGSAYSNYASYAYGASLCFCT